MQITTYLNFNGNCEEAFKYYAEVLGGTILIMMPHEGTPAAEGVSDEWRGKILHARMSIGDSLLMASDAPPQYQATPQGFSVSIQVKDTAEGERIFNALAEGGKVNMPYGKTFWAEGFGMLVDRFEIPWMINCETAAA